MPKFAVSVIVPMKHTYMVEDDSITTIEEAKTAGLAQAQKDLTSPMAVTVDGAPYTLTSVAQQFWDTGVTQID